MAKHYDGKTLMMATTLMKQSAIHTYYYQKYLLHQAITEIMQHDIT